MALMMGNSDTALREGGTSDEQARKAAEEVADHTKQLADIRIDLALVKGLLWVVCAGVLAPVMKTLFV